MGDAVRIGDHERRPGVGVGLGERLDGLGVLGAERDLRDVDVAVGHREQAEVLLGHVLAGGGELGGRAERGRLRLLAAGVRVDLGVEDQDVDVAALGQDVVEAAVADVVGPAVAADDPHALADQVVGEPGEARAPRPSPARPAGAGGRRPAPAAPRSRPRRAARPRAARAPARRRARRPAGAADRARGGRADRPRAACRSRTRRCPRTASWPRPGRARRGWSCTAWSAGCRRRSTSSRWRWRSARGRRTAGSSA